MIKKNLLLSIVLIMVMSSCVGSQKKSVIQEQDRVSVIDSVNNKEESVAYCGTYKGTLPCADCVGIKTTLKINGDNTYNLRSEFLGKKEAVFIESGTYDIIDGNIIELITPSSGDKSYYKILDNGIALSDSEGALNQGELADHYILKKQ